jgi:hypothetical protein
VALRFGQFLCALLELLRERLVVEEDPGIVEFAIPSPFQITNRWNQFLQLFIPDKGDERRVGPGGVGTVGGIVILVGSP